jgi:xanthosine utilization system XapX-like protein
MKRRASSFLFAALVTLATASAQMVPVGGMAQQIVGREMGGIDCQTGNPTGFGTAALYYQFIAGIPEQYLFKAGATVQNETTSVLTSVFPVVSTSQTTNDKMTDVYLQPHTVYYYYHPNSTPKDWTDFDAFQAGQLIGILQLQKNMFSVIPPAIAFGVNSGPWVYTADFTLPDGEVVNMANFTEGITVHILGTIGQFVSNAAGQPVVVNLTNSTGTVKLGTCAVMVTFSGAGIHSASSASSKKKNKAVVNGTDVQ